MFCMLYVPARLEVDSFDLYTQTSERCSVVIYVIGANEVVPSGKQITPWPCKIPQGFVE
jgi:hypothetical protein